MTWLEPDILLVDGHAFSWQRISELRRQQLEAWRADQARQLALFELKDDCRPEAERTATRLSGARKFGATMTALHVPRKVDAERKCNRTLAAELTALGERIVRHRLLYK